jgi:DegV family protein with EDD domain
MEVKMNKFRIFVDSSANLTDEMIKDNDIGVVSYTCRIDGVDTECYEENKPYKEIAKRFYDAMREGHETKTSLVNCGKIIDAVTPTFKEGYDVLLVTISSQISGTYAQALQAAEMLKVTFPDRKLIVADSFNAGMGEGLVALQAVKLRDMGESIEACAKWIDDNKLKFNSVFTVSDLKYLRKGGRISATLAIAGTLLNIKPILKGDGSGKISACGKEKGRRKALQRLAETFKENVVNAENQTVCIAHADCEEDATVLAELVKGYGAKDVVINWYDICTGSHVGPGTVALFFFGNDRAKKEEELARQPLLAHPVKVNK